MGHRLDPADGVDELFLDAPASDLVGRDVHLAHLRVAPLSAVERQVAALAHEPERPFGPVNPDVRRRPEARDVGHLDVELPARLQFRHDIDIVRDVPGRATPSVGVRLVLDDGVSNGRHGRVVAYPAHHGLCPDTHGHDVVAGVITALAPVQLRVPVREVAGADPGVDADQIPQVAIGDHVDNLLVERQGVRRRYDLRHQVRALLGGVEHGVRFRGVRGHAGLDKDVLVRLKRRDREDGVHVGPGADADGVDVFVVDDVDPVLDRVRDVELIGEACR